MSFHINRHNGCIQISASQPPEQITQDLVKGLYDEVKKIETSEIKEHKWVVYDCGPTKSLHPTTVPMLCRISSYLEQYDIKFAIVGETKIGDLIVKNGIDRMVIPYSSIEVFNKTNGIMNKENIKLFLNTLLDSIIMSMKVLIETDVSKTNVEVVKDISKIPIIQAGAMAGILSAHFSGNIVIGFTTEVFIKMMSVFLQMEITEVTPEIKDGAAELLNVIIGQTKIKLNEKGFEIRQVIPNVITGERIEISPMAKQSSVLITCNSGVGEFIILLTTNSNS